MEVNKTEAERNKGLFKLKQLVALDINAFTKSGDEPSDL